MNFGEAFAGGIMGAADAVGKITSEQIESQIMQAREQALIQFREQSQGRLMDRQEQTRREGKRADFEFENDPENVKREVARKGSIMGAEATARGEAETAIMADPKRQKAERDLARNRHVESAASAADARLTNLKIGQFEEAEKWRKIAVDPSKTEAERVAARDNYQLLSGKDSDQWEIVKSKEANTGMESVIGRHNKRTGEYQKYDEGAFKATGNAPAAKTATQAQVDAYAKKKGISLKDAMNGLKAQGWNIQ